MKIWDLSSGDNAATFEGHSQGICSISFSENGYYLASASPKENVVKVWDLRKPKIFKTIEINNEIRSIKFDKSGSYLGVVGANLKLFNMKTWNLFAEFNDHSDIITDVDFARDCRYIATTSMDRNMKIYSSSN